MTTKPKFKLPTAAQMQKALPVVSAGLSILSSMPFNRKVTKTLATAATVIGGAPAIDTTAASVDHSVNIIRDQLRCALDELEAATEETPKARILALTSRVLVLARIIVENT